MDKNDFEHVIEKFKQAIKVSISSNKKNDSDYEKIFDELNGFVIEFESTNEELQKANQNLIKLEQKYESLFESATVANIIIDNNYIIKQANKIAYDILQSSKIELINRSLTFFISTEHQNKFDQEFKNFLVEPFNLHLDLIILGFLGRKLPVTLSATKINLQNDDFEYLITIVDQSIRNQFEDELIESKGMYVNLVESLPFSIYTTDRNSKITSCNYKFAESLNKTKEELIGRYLSELYESKILNQIEVNNELAMQLGKPIKRIEEMHYTDDTQPRFTEINYNPILDDKENVIGLQIIQHDVTEQVKSEQLLKDSEYKYRKIVEDSSDLFIVSSGKGKIRFVGSNSERIIGFAPEEFKKIEIANFIHPDDIAIFDTKYKESFDSLGETHNLEIRFRNKKSDWIWLEIAITNLTNDPIINGIITNIRDITDKKNAEQITINAQHRYKALFNFLHDGVMLINPLTRCPVEFNKAAYKSLGYTFEEFLNLSINDIDILETPQVTQARIDKILRDGYDEFETKHKRKDGSIRPTFVSVSLVEIENQSLILTLYHDISQLKIAQYEKEENEKKYKLLVENAFDGIYLQVGRRYSYVNESFCKITGYSYEELVSDSFDFDIILTEKSFVSVNDRFAKRQRGEFVPSKFDFEICSKNGKIKHVEISAEILFLNGQQTVLGIMRDVTDSKVIEYEVNKARESALKNAEISNTILNNLGHELRTPLNGILGFTKILMMDLSDADHLEMLSMIYHSGERLKKTLSALLTMSELESAKYQIILSESNLLHFIQMYKDFTIDLLHQKPVEFVLITNDEDIIFKTDEYLLHQALYNILDNSFKFTDEGTIILSAERKLINGNYKAIIEVRDTGVGIEQEKIDTIFLPFRQGSEGIQRKFEGMGIGLTIVQKIIQKLNGQIEITSEVGKGTMVRIIFDCI